MRRANLITAPTLSCYADHERAALSCCGPYFGIISARRVATLACSSICYSRSSFWGVIEFGAYVQFATVMYLVELNHEEFFDRRLVVGPLGYSSDWTDSDGPIYMYWECGCTGAVPFAL